MYLFIPKVSMKVDFDILDQVFRDLYIGNVIYADFHRKNNYQYVFIEIITYFESETALQFEKRIENGEKVKISFNDTNEFWDIKQYIPREKRGNKISVDDEYPDIVMSVFRSVFA
jgi:hypothetical protein